MRTIRSYEKFPLEIGNQEFTISVQCTYTPADNSPIDRDEYGRPMECERSDDELTIEKIWINGIAVPYFETIMNADILAKIEDKTRDEIMANAE